MAQSFGIGQATQTISFAKPADQTFTLGGTIGLTATGGASGNPVTFASTTTGVCSTGGSNGATVTFVSAGTCSVTASQAGDTNYAAATDVAQSFGIGQATQTISFAKPSDQTFTSGGTISLTATGGASGNPVTFASTTTGVCSTGGTNGATVTFVSAGTCSVTASQAGDTNYVAATDVARSFGIGQAAQVISFAPPTDQTFIPGGTIGLTATGGASGKPVTFASTTTGVCTIAGSTVTMVSAGTCAVTASQMGNVSYAAATDVSQSFAIGQAAQVISFTAPAAQTFAPGGTVALSATGGASGNPVTFASTTTDVCTVAGSTVTLVSAGTCAITASQAGTASFAAAADVSQSFAIGLAAQTITFTQPVGQTVPGNALALVASASSGLPVTFSTTTPGVCSVSGTTVSLIQSGECAVTANQPGDARYAAAPAVQRTMEVGRIATTVSVTASSTTRQMGEAFTLTAVVTPASAPGTMSFTNGSAVLCADVALSAGSATCTTAIRTAGANTIVASYGGSNSYAAASSAPIVVAVANTVAETARKTGRFLGLRSQAIVSSQFGGERQIDRLIEAGRNTEAGPEAQQFTGERLGSPSRLGAGPQAHSFSQMRGAAGTRDGVLSELRSTFDTSDDTSMDQRNGRLPFDMSGSTAGNHRFEFAASLSQFIKHDAETRAKKARGAGGLGFDATAYLPSRSRFNPFDIWIEGKYTRLRDDRDAGDIGGHFGLLTVGLDYVVNPSVLIGTYVQYDTMSQSSNRQRVEIEGTGWMVGTYGTVRLSENLFWQSRAAIGKSENEIAPSMTYRDSFDSHRWLASSSLVGRWNVDAWTITPSATITYLEDTAESYRDSLGSVIPEVRSRLGQAKIGPEFSYSYAPSQDLLIQPRFGMHLVWDFASSVTAAGIQILDAEAVGVGVRGRAEAGLRAQTTDGYSLDLSASFDGIGAKDYNAVTGRALLRIPLN